MKFLLLVVMAILFSSEAVCEAFVEGLMKNSCAKYCRNYVINLRIYVV